MPNSSTAARQRPRLPPRPAVPEKVEKLLAAWRESVSPKLSREQLLQIALLEGAERIDRYPDLVLRRLVEVRQPAPARRRGARV